MKVGDYIKHVNDNTGEGPEGSWIIDAIGESVVYFSDDTWVNKESLEGWFDEGRAVIWEHDPNGHLRVIDKHNFI